MVKPKEPLVTPPNVKVLAVTVIVGVAVKVMVPVPWVRLLLPVKVKLAPMLKALVMLTAPEVASIVPPEMVKVPVPRAAALLISNVPFVNVVPPV